MNNELIDVMIVIIAIVDYDLGVNFCIIDIFNPRRAFRFRSV